MILIATDKAVTTYPLVLYSGSHWMNQGMHFKRVIQQKIKQQLTKDYGESQLIFPLIEVRLLFPFYRQKLDLVLDFENGGVSKHLGQIADSMYEWEGPVAKQLGLTPSDVAAIKVKYPSELRLQT